MRLHLTLLLFAILMPAPAQQVPAPTGSVSGTIRCQDGNTPARGATVHLIPLSSLVADPASPSPATLHDVNTETDLTGTFAVQAIAPGIYVMQTELPGYSDPFDLIHTVLGRLSPAQRRKVLSSLPTLTVSPGAESHGNVVLSRGASIDGAVTVDTGGLVGPNFVTATLVSSPLLGRLELGDHTAPTFSRQGRLDDLGHFRIAGLPAGQYRLSLRLLESYLVPTIENNKLLGFTTSRAGSGALTVYAPSAISRADATLISVQEGENIAGAELTVPLRQLHSVHGIVLRQGNPVPGVSVMLRRPSQSLTDIDDAIPDAITDQAGVFTFDLVPSGSFRITAKLFHHDTSNAPEPSTNTVIELGDSPLPDLLLTLPPSLPAQR